MDILNEEMENRLQRNKEKIKENIDMGKNMGVNKISAILAMCDEETEMKLISWLLSEGYKVSLMKEDYSILTIEW